jgi:stearoyl-CoA desaturase (delta-9 desaturase)
MSSIAEVEDRIVSAVPEWARLAFSYARFFALHLFCLAAIWTGVSWRALILCACVYTFQILSVTVGYHRYFSHRAYKTSRVMQFILGFFAQMSAQKGVLWWAAHHRFHHRHSDMHDDIHSPKDGIWWSYCGWILSESTRNTRLAHVEDLAKYPELRLLNAFTYTPVWFLAIGCYFLLGWQGVVVGWLWATILSYHATFANNCFAHIFGSRRYETTDTSRNNWVLAFVVLGEGWHNNHHRYASSARQGFFWWEIDITWYCLLAMSKLGLIWDLRPVPEAILAGDITLPAEAAE